MHEPHIPRVVSLGACHAGAALGGEVEHEEDARGQVRQARERQALHRVALRVCPRQQPGRVRNLHSLRLFRPCLKKARFIRPVQAMCQTKRTCSVLAKAPRCIAADQDHVELLLATLYKKHTTKSPTPAVWGMHYAFLYSKYSRLWVRQCA